MKRLNPRAALVFAHDIAAAITAWLGSYWLRLNLSLPEEFLHGALETLIWVIPLQTFMFWYFGLYRGMWRFASLPDLKRIVKAVAASAVLIPLVIVMTRTEAVVPRSVLIIDPILLVLIMGGSRVTYRAWREHRLSSLLEPSTKPLLVIGAGPATDFLIRQLERSPNGYLIKGILDDGSDNIGRQMHDIPVLGPVTDLAHWVAHTDSTAVVLAQTHVASDVRAELTRLQQDRGIEVLSLPSLSELMTQGLSKTVLRAVSADDLLGRDPVKIDHSQVSGLVRGRVVLVTGAGGSIGGELCRQIAQYQPARLVLLDSSEFNLYQIEYQLQRHYPGLAIDTSLCDVTDSVAVTRLFDATRPAVVFHAAAYKHVPMLERKVRTAVRNNVLGTQQVALAAGSHGCERFVLISTDKAVNPTNVMGATKRLTEILCQSLNGRFDTRYVTVRFGNVLDSAGSVVPRFREQIAAGGPVTVTDPNIERYFMTIPEACQLIMRAAAAGSGGEIYVLDMGEPVRISTLAEQMIRLSGMTPGEDIEIVYTGLRPGEKLFEELFHESETVEGTALDRILLARHRAAPAWQELDATLAQIDQAVDRHDDEALTRIIRQLVPEYQAPATTDATVADAAAADSDRLVDEQRRSG